MIVRDLIDLKYKSSSYIMPYVIDGVEYKDPENDIPRPILLSPIDTFDVKEDKNDKTFKIYLKLLQE